MAPKQPTALEALFSHLVLPPKLPQAFDGDEEALIRSLGKRLEDACSGFHRVGDADIWNLLNISLRSAQILKQGCLNQGDLLHSLNYLIYGRTPPWLVIHIVRQNAALLIHRDERDNTVIFEAFQTAAPTAAVLEANHALTWDFPGRVVAIPLDTFSNPGFLAELSGFLEQASTESYPRFAARANKGGKSVAETRDVPSPHLISEMLMSLLEGLGSATHVRQVRKRVRDDIVLSSSELPWRRSPYWLVLRVAVQRMLSHSHQDKGDGVDRVYYKFIMCEVLANLLKDSAGTLQPEQTLMLRAKLCRRLAKLESERKTASGAARSLYDAFFAAKSIYYEDTLNQIGESVTAAWENYKKAATRQIPRLPRRAPESDLVLTLPNSGSILQGLLDQSVDAPISKAAIMLPSLAEGTVSQVNKLAACHVQLVDHEASLSINLEDTVSPEEAESKCCELSHKIQDYLALVGKTYQDDALLTSHYLLLVFELWVAMDQAATRACPLLHEYHPVFDARALDVLCLQTMDELTRLQRVQEYVAARVEASKHRHNTIFDDPKQPASFPAQYFQHNVGGQEMVALSDRITAASSRAKEAKVSELEALMKKYTDLTAAINSGTCTCRRNPDGSVDIRGCKRCYHWRCRRRLTIDAHEDFLPFSKPNRRAHRAALLLELAMPRYLEAYRTATWKLRMLGTRIIPKASEVPELTLAEFDQLAPFWTSAAAAGRNNRGMVLASAKKSFLRTHYRKAQLPTGAKDVLQPFGPEFAYYDATHRVWAHQLHDAPWFQHLLGRWIPNCIPDPYESPDTPVGDVYHPTSYEIAANESKCPSDMSVHEYSALQRAVSGRGRRWLVLLVELAATNVNFSSDSTVSLFNHLALQAGPCILEKTVLREAHVVFQDETFRVRLHEQLLNRLEALTSSWREVHCMSLIVCFTLRLYHLSPPGQTELALKLLDKIREILSGWLTHLRNETRATHDPDTARKTTTHAFWAALLCRQTYAVYLDDSRRPDAASYEELQTFFSASIALQENLVVNLEELSPTLRHLLNRDLRMAYKLQNVIKTWISRAQTALEAAISETWTSSGGKQRSFRTWQFLSARHEGWIVSRTVSSKWAASQTVHYHLLQGHLLIDGKPLGRLPLEMSENPSVQELFGKQHLLTRPSGLAGMQYQLVQDIGQHQIHLGWKGDKVIIRAAFMGSLLEYVPRTVFKSDSELDLPSGLVEDCVHWLNLHTGELEMRRKPNIWKQKLSNWILDVQRRTAVRNKATKSSSFQGRVIKSDKLGSCLVEPRSDVGMRIADIFRDFEDVEKLTVYQPAGGGQLSVEMKRLEIRFFVNRSNLLECPQLRSEVDPNQDAGTFYGLRSQIVLRSVHNPDRRSILVPTGKFSCKRRGMHVAVRVSNEGTYARFSINPLLGRLECPPEPVLLYLKATLHAYTSFPIPDQLTGRTGTEEAYHCLSAAHSQPWTPSEEATQRLLVLKSLMPIREYYPRYTKLYQNVSWNENLTMTIQHEGLAFAVERIIRQIQKLEALQIHTKADVRSEFEEVSIDHLSLRGMIRRQIYERINSNQDSEILNKAAQIVPFTPQDRINASEQSLQVYRCVKALSDDVVGVPELANLGHLLQKCDVIGGFENTPPFLDIQLHLDADISASWGTFVQACRQWNSEKRYRKYFLLALLAFGKKTDMGMMAWLVAIAKLANLRDIEPPTHAAFTNYKGSKRPSQSNLKSFILNNQLTFDEYPSGRGTKRLVNGRFLTRAEFLLMQTDELNRISDSLVNLWPDIPQTIDELRARVGEPELELIELEKMWAFLKPELERMSHNRDLAEYLRKLQQTAEALAQGLSQTERNMCRAIWSCEPGKMVELPSAVAKDGHRIPQLLRGLAQKPYGSSDIISKLRAAYSIKESRSSQERTTSTPVPPAPSELSLLRDIVNKFASSTNNTRQKYGEDLLASLTALLANRAAPQARRPGSVLGSIDLEINELQSIRTAHAATIFQALSTGEEGFTWLNIGGLWPCLSPVSLLEQLREGMKPYMGEGMREALVWYGVLITKVQRLLRMRDAQLCYDNRKHLEEKSYEGHVNWDPLQYPEWLLLEIDCDILIREAQVDVARAIVSPQSGRNSVLQMNMGQGKTSCIVPMAVTILANKSNLCRLIVPRALLLQTAQVMQSRLGGLIGRQVSHLPFARRSPASEATLGHYKSIHQDTLHSGGVMLCLSEHILSFKLSGLQRLADGDLETATRMIQIQEWLDASSRDILDESDLTLSTKNQLIYPSGPRTPVDGHPQRWLVVEELLSLVEAHVPLLREKFRGGTQVLWRHRGYPIIHFLHRDVEDALNAWLVDDVCQGRFSRLQLKENISGSAREAVRQIISGTDGAASIWKDARSALTDEIFGPKTLCLLRGLISERIVLLCLKKRWNVQFGLHPDRPGLAVPFEAKGVPSPTAEFGHPDTALVLTCLAFYQTGLSKGQITESLQHVVKSDDPAAYYEQWVHGPDVLPATLQHWNLLNADDEAQVDELWRYLRFDRNVLNHYMNTFVFPVHANQFGVKLQASGWDIPLLSRSTSSGIGCETSSLTTGFSGTNDNKRMLPQNIKQEDLSSLLQTNAEVLGYLLQKRNQTCYQAVVGQSKQLTERELLKLLCDKEMRVLIDAGAYVLEMENHEVAEAWLEIDHQAQGAVYFGRNGQILVRARFQKKAVPLLSSPFADNLEECVVYIDEAHTRGTDLKLPTHAKGAVTLGLDQTKDQTVQAAMRLRQLASSQSVAFVAPPEVYRSIQDLRVVHLGAGTKHLPVASDDVVRWLLEQSCKANENMMSLYVAQGLDFCRRTNARWEHDGFLTDKKDMAKLLKVLRQPEEQTIDQLYGPKLLTSSSTHEPCKFPGLRAYMTDLVQQKQHLLATDSLAHASAFQQVEQEREIEFEVEEVREKQKPTLFKPLAFNGLSEYLIRFVTTGILDGEATFIHAFSWIGKTTVGRKFCVTGTTSQLYVSHEFCKTIVPDESGTHEGILRPVEWILWSSRTNMALVIIPEEAELLIPLLRELKSPKVFLLTYAAPVSRSMQVFDNFRYYSIPLMKDQQPLPEWLSIELGVLAGGLYFDLKHYEPLLAWLGDSKDVPQFTLSQGVKSRLSIGQPLQFLLEWLTYRRQGQDITHTPMGLVCQRRALQDRSQPS